MSITTSSRFVICANCQQPINQYYYEFGFKKGICEKCLIKVNNGSFPKGGLGYKPCHLCVEPVIRWHNEGIRGNITDCGQHCIDEDEDICCLFDQ